MMIMRFLETITRLSMILFSFLAMIIIGASFGYFQKFVGGNLLDMSMNGPDALTQLSEMSAVQKQSHTWITLILDSLYPIAYGSFFAGATVKLAGGSKHWLALPALITVIADFCENIVQIFALNGHENLILAKSVFTPIKFSGFIITAIVFLLFVIIALARTYKKRTSHSNE